MILETLQEVQNFGLHQGEGLESTKNSMTTKNSADMYIRLKKKWY